MLVEHEALGRGQLEVSLLHGGMHAFAEAKLRALQTWYSFGCWPERFPMGWDKTADSTWGQHAVHELGKPSRSGAARGTLAGDRPQHTEKDEELDRHGVDHLAALCSHAYVLVRVPGSLPHGGPHPQ